MTPAPVPMLLDARKCAWSIEDVNAARAGGAARRRVLSEKMALTADGERGPRLYDMADGVAIIRIYGPLFDDDLILPSWGMSGYGGLAVQLEAALADPAVKAVMFDIDSPGGVAAPGLEDLAGDVFAGRAVKPIVANVRHMAASAAYWLASAATAVVLPDLGEAGSIGVWTLHVDYSAALEQMGVKPTLIFAGRHKVDGNPFEPLPDSVRADIQAEVDEIRARFAGAVARHRGMSASAVLDTEARLYRGGAAVDAGLADEVMPRKSALQALIDSVAAGA